MTTARMGSWEGGREGEGYDGDVIFSADNMEARYNRC
jgi:hypothetical protein